MPGVRFFLLACLILATLAWPCATAASTGILAGTVTDLDGNSIPGASVSLYRGQTLVAVEKNPQTTIDSPSIGQVGHYGFRGLATGRYSLVVRKSYGAGREYKAEQQVSVTSGTTIQDIVLDVPRPTSTPLPTYTPQYEPMAGFGAPIAIISLAFAILVLWRRGL